MSDSVRVSLVTMKRTVLILLLLPVAIRGFGVAHAQSYRFVDSSGNIHFVDSIGEVPRQYREQIIPPTPTVAVDAKTAKKLEAQRQREALLRQRELERKKREKERALERQKRLAERQAAKQAAQEAAAATKRVRKVESSGEGEMEQFR